MRELRFVKPRFVPLVPTSFSGFASGSFSGLLMRLALVTVSVAMAARSEAREVKFKDYPLEVREGDRVHLTGVNGSVRLIPVTKALLPAVAPAAGAVPNGLLRVRKVLSDKAPARVLEGFDQWTFTVRRDESVWRIEVKGPDAKSDWEAQLKAGFPEFQFEIESPSVPVEVYFREGRFEAQNWKAPLVVQVNEGQARLAKNEGPLRIQLQRGEVRVDGHKGRIEIDGFNPKIQLSNIEGDLNLDNFAGESALQTLKGSLQLRAFSGQTVAGNIGGGCDFELGRGSLSLQGLEGGLRGQLDNGSVSAKLSGEPEVNIESQEGSVSLRLPADSGAQVRLQTEEGSLQAPSQLGTSKTSTQKFVTGRLSGSGKGSIFVKTKTGNVRLN
ncbi:MAG: DUF4097 domain-containing protein [Bdellovibrionaceae bacterium]|nr:DUF4097 domain-containing protein [Pseudobdellovibrionaceae bacterium]